MPVQSGRVIVDPTQGAFNRNTDKEIQQIKREIVKAPAAQAPAGALSLGTRRAYGTPFSNTVGATTVVEAASWTFETGFDGADASLEPTVSVVSGDPMRLQVADAGWYFLRWYQLIEFTGAGATAVRMKLEHDNGYVRYRWTEAPMPGGSSILAGAGFHFDETVGPLYLEANETFFPHIQYDGGSALVSKVFMIEVTRIS